MFFLSICCISEIRSFINKWLNQCDLTAVVLICWHQQVPGFIRMLWWALWERASNEALPIIPLLMQPLAPIETLALLKQDHHRDDDSCRTTNHSNTACSRVGKEIVKWVILLLYWIIKSRIVLRGSELAVRWIKMLANKVVKRCAVFLLMQSCNTLVGFCLL